MARCAPDGRWALVASDCLAYLHSLPSDSVDLVFTSPPYEDARSYLEYGRDLGIARNSDNWVSWMADVAAHCVRVCRGLCAFVVEGRTKNYRWSASPVLLMERLHNLGFNLSKPPIYARRGIFGSGGPDWWRNDYEFIICVTRPGKLPWSDNTACGTPPEYAPGGDPSHRSVNGDRARRKYKPPKIANPGNVIGDERSEVILGSVGKGHMGDELAHENEAPFPEWLAERFVKSFCPPGGLVLDPFMGSGTTLAVALKNGRRAWGCDLRQSQVELAYQRILGVERDIEAARQGEVERAGKPPSA